MNRLLLLVLLVAVIDLNMAMPKGEKEEGGNGKGKGHRAKVSPRRKWMSEEQINEIKTACGKEPQKCKGQQPKSEEKKKRIKDTLLNDFVESGMSQEEAQQKIDNDLSKFLEIKKQILANQGLSSDVDAQDDGTFGGDMLLAPEDADQLLEWLKQPDQEEEAAREKRGAATSFEEKPYRKWTMPVPYYIKSGFTSAEITAIHNAISEIETAIDCVSFQEETSLKSVGQIHYIKINSGGACGGSSWVGRMTDRPNTVELSATAGGCSGQYGKAVAIHETLHALGVGHEMSRRDRNDSYDRIDIYPTDDCPDQFLIDPYSTSYGTDYNVQSIMHYEQYACATFYPTSTTYGFIKTYSLTYEDKLELNRMYCVSSTCVDKDVDCGLWANWGYCGDDDGTSEYCPRSCGMCDDDF